MEANSTWEVFNAFSVCRKEVTPLVWTSQTSNFFERKGTHNKLAIKLGHMYTTYTRTQKILPVNTGTFLTLSFRVPLLDLRRTLCFSSDKKQDLAHKWSEFCWSKSNLFWVSYGLSIILVVLFSIRHVHWTAVSVKNTIWPTRAVFYNLHIETTHAKDCFTKNSKLCIWHPRILWGIIDTDFLF